MKPFLLWMLVLIATSSQLSAGILISGQFHGGAAQTGSGVIGKPSDTWNVLAVTGKQQNFSSLFDSQKQPTSVSAKVEVNGADAGTYGSPDSSPMDPATTPLMTSYVYANTNTILFSLSGLTPNTRFAMILYGAGNQPGQGSTFTLSPSNGGTTTGTSGDTRQISDGPQVAYVVIKGATDANGAVAVTVSPRKDGGIYSVLNGFQIQMGEGDVEDGTTVGMNNNPTAPNVAESDSKIDYLALHDHNGPSGVPLGGIGVGCFDLAPDGRFTRMGVNDWFTDAIGGARDRHPKMSANSFFSVWQEGAGAVRLVRDKASTYGMPGMAHTTYTGLFPFAEIRYEGKDVSMPVTATLKAYSGLVPHDIKDSSLPVVWFDVVLSNSSENAVNVATAFSWEDIISRYLLDPEDPNKVPSNAFAVNFSTWNEMKPVPTSTEICDSGDWTGLRQFAEDPIIPKKATFQNYNTDTAIMVEKQPGLQVSYLPAYSTSEGDHVWSSFCQSGSFASSVLTSPIGLSDPAQDPKAGAIAVKFSLPAKSTKTIHFLVSWYSPELKPDRTTKEQNTFYGTGDYGKFFQQYFSDIKSLLAYAEANRQIIIDGTDEWHQLLLKSNFPDWLKFKTINSIYTLYTQGMLNRAGDFTMMEGGMGGLAGTMDVRMIVHPLYQKMFPILDHREMDIFSKSQEPSGAILHFVGAYFDGMGTLDGPAPTPVDITTDGTGSYIQQLVKDYEQTGDLSRLQAHADNIRRVLKFLKSQIVDESGIPRGRATYDDYNHPPIFVYLGGSYLATLKSAVKAAKALNDQTMLQECTEQYKQTFKGYMSLWTGTYFADGSDLHGKSRVDNLFHQGQIGGQFLSRFNNCGDILPMDMIHDVFLTQFQRILPQVPDYYADKVWDLNQSKGLDNAGSRCWPFQLEAFTAFPAIQAGFVEDGLDIMKHIQLVHLRKGWSWTQNLWNPGELTRMDTAVTWSIMDVLAGSGLDVNTKTLTLGPALIPGTGSLQEPLFFPSFWGWLDYEPSAGTATFKIVKTFGDQKFSIDKICVQPNGVSSSLNKIIAVPSFTIQEGAVLDLSPALHDLEKSATMPSVLARAGKVPIPTVAVPTGDAWDMP